jgi:cell pole-organizing protein PopZ
MSAANASAPSPSLQEEMRAHEPSMEEILASIRRIIADDESLASTGRERRRREGSEEARASLRDAYPAPALDPVPDFEPLQRVEAARRAPPSVDDVRKLRIDNSFQPALDEKSAFEDAEIDAVLSMPAAEPARDETLLSATVASSVASHFDALTTSLLINENGLIEKYVQDMLRPMLKQWLDDNLPMIVERLVRAEIERVARGGRR